MGYGYTGGRLENGEVMGSGAPRNPLAPPVALGGMGVGSGAGVLNTPPALGPARQPGPLDPGVSLHRTVAPTCKPSGCIGISGYSARQWSVQWSPGTRSGATWAVVNVFAGRADALAWTFQARLGAGSRTELLE